MAFEKIRAEIDLLLAGMAEKPEDEEELELRLREKLGALRAFGLPLPADLVELEAMLDAELTAEEIEKARKSAPEEE